MTGDDVKMIEARRRWVCMVGRSGYHNGCDCRPSDPHGGDWHCGWYYTAMVRAPRPETATV